MATGKYVAHFFIKILILILLIGVVKSSVVNYLNPLSEPCYGAGNGKVRALGRDNLLGDCGEYAECLGDQTVKVEKCEYDNPYFDAETGECVNHDDVCFKCSKTKYELFSVPHICQQFILCFNGKPLLSACTGDLVFDARPGIHQCNEVVLPNECFREDKDDWENKPCSDIVGKEPQYEWVETNPGVYYVCYGEMKRLRLTCPSQLVFNKEKGACDLF